MRKTVFSLVIDAEMLEKIEEIARSEGRSISEVIREAIKRYLEERK